MDRRSFVRLGAAAAAGVAGTELAASPIAAASLNQRRQAPSVEPGRRSDAWVGLNFDNLAANYQRVRARAGGRPVMAVVKANAYGHGLVPVARALSAAGAQAFLVSNTQEAMALRLAGVERPILHFGRVFGGAGELVVEHGIEQMVDSVNAVSDLVAAAAMHRTEATVHVHIDTGLGRMGVPWQQAGDLLEYVGGRSRVRIGGVSTTLTEEPYFDAMQIERLVDTCKGATAAGIAIGRRHAASSAALLAMPEAHLDMVRPGITLYGHYPSEAARERDADLGLKPVLGLRARVVEVRNLVQGDTLGYHRVYVARHPQTIAVLPVGYADGYPPEVATGGGHVWIRGARCPLVAEMSSTHCFVLLPDGLGIQPGELATLIATGDERTPFDAPTESQSIEVGADPFGGPPLAHMVAAWAGISVYQLLIRLNPKLPRTLERRRR